MFKATTYINTDTFRLIPDIGYYPIGFGPPPFMEFVGPGLVWISVPEIMPSLCGNWNAPKTEELYLVNNLRCLSNMGRCSSNGVNILFKLSIIWCELI